jgi:hypothetical protein
MELPWGLRRQWEDSERNLQLLLRRLGLDRAGLAQLAGRMRARLPARARPAGGVQAAAGKAERRGLHV